VTTDLDGVAQAFIFHQQTGEYERITADKSAYAVQQQDALIWYPVQPAQSIAILWPTSRTASLRPAPASLAETIPAAQFPPARGA
jgi:hypothetical protein